MQHTGKQGSKFAKVLKEAYAHKDSIVKNIECMDKQISAAEKHINDTLALIKSLSQEVNGFGILSELVPNSVAQVLPSEPGGHADES